MAKKYIILIILGVILVLNIIRTITSTDPFVQAKRLMLSFSQGDKYYGTLRLWYFYAQKSDWVAANKLQSRLDANDISFYKSNNYPQEIQKKITSLNNQKNKTINDWVQLAQFQLRLNQKKEAISSLDKARQIDPIRDDLNKLYFQLSQ